MSITGGITTALAQFGVDEHEVRHDTTFEQLEIDSLALVELVEVLQEQFRVTLTDEEVTKAATISDVSSLIESKVAAAR